MLDVECVTFDCLFLSGYKRSMNGWRKKIQCLPHIIMDAIILTVALFCTFSFECLRLLKCFYNIKVSQTKIITVLLNEIVSFFLFIHQFRHRHSISFLILIPVPTPFPFWFLFVRFLSSSLQNYSMFWRFHCCVCVYLFIPLMEILYSLADRNFDIPDRTFHSMATTWRLSSFESATDVKELIPEFFFLPEFLENREGMALGSMIEVWKWNRCYCNFWRIFI